MLYIVYDTMYNINIPRIHVEFNLARGWEYDIKEVMLLAGQIATNCKRDD